MAPGSQEKRGGVLRGSGNTLCPEGQQGARRQWVWRTCPSKWAKSMSKPLQEEEHSTGQASEEVGEVGSPVRQRMPALLIMLTPLRHHFHHERNKMAFGSLP